MKCFFTAGLLLLPWIIGLSALSFAGEKSEKSPLSGQIPIQFVYIHGTNQNTPDSRSRFEHSVGRLHGEIRGAFESSRVIQTQLLHHNQAHISAEPVAFFWGDRSQSELEFLKQDLTLLTGIKTRLAGLAREQMAYMLHDAVWFERPKNKYQILKALHETVMTAHGENRPIILLGHSAGSLVAFNYMTYLLPFLDQETLLRITKPPQDIVNAIRFSNLPPTCALALIDSGAFRPDLSGRLMSTYQEPELGIASLSSESRQLYLEKFPEAIRIATKTSCLPPNALQGMITFGSPIPLFESDVGRHEDVFSLLVSYMLKYLLENGMIWIHINHIKDPVGFPMPDYHVMAERIKANQGIDIQRKGGMIASHSNIRKWAFIQNAHTWYWKKPKLFAKELVKTYEASYTEPPGKAKRTVRPPDPVMAEAIPPQVTPKAFITLPIRKIDQSDAKKLNRAKMLSARVREALERDHAEVAVIARQGPPLTGFIDKTGMTHTGIMFRHPITREWLVYSLYSNPEEDYKTASLWRQDPDDFFYGQRNNKQEALLLIPSAKLQSRLLARLYRQPFVTLLPENHRYNLVAPVESPLSINCTKWILLQLFAAQEDTDDVPTLLRAIERDYPLPVVKPSRLTRMVLRRKRDVVWRELNPPGHVHTVTVENLSKAPVFEKRLLLTPSR